MTFEREMAMAVALAVKSATAPLLAQQAVLAERIAQLEIANRSLAERAAIPGPPGEPGKDADIFAVKAIVEQAVAALPLPVPAVIEAFVAKAVAKLPVPRDGKDADPEAIQVAVEKAVAALPKPKDGKDGASVDLLALRSTIETEVTKAVSALPVPKDGRDGTSVDEDRAQLWINLAVAKAMAALPVPVNGHDGKDGVGVTSALIDREGHLILTLSDGSTKDVGKVVGKDGADGLRGKDIDLEDVRVQIETLVAAIPKPKDGMDGAPGTNGKDGLGFDDLSVICDDDHGYVLKFSRGDQVKLFRLAVPHDRKVWQAGIDYPRGAGVTVKGSWWIAQEDNRNVRPGDGTPESARCWRLAVKAGQNGKDGKDGKNGDE